MSTRTHWLRPIDKRITACGRNAFQSDIFEGSAAEYLGVSNFCVKCERAAQKEQQPRPRSCKHCGSQAINPGFRERPQGIDLDLCDVCFWRVRAQPELRPGRSFIRRINQGGGVEMGSCISPPTSCRCHQNQRCGSDQGRT